jgi:hypothetical protein
VIRYLGAVLPKVLEQVSTCKDKIAQQYLLESIIQVATITSISIIISISIITISTSSCAPGFPRRIPHENA